MENKPLRTATVTWITYRNFGTYLQAYALQQAMKSLGYENRILDDRRFVLSNPLRAFLGRWKRRLLGQPTAPVNIAAYRDFRERYLQVDERWTDYADLNLRYDLFLCGSDQIWSPYFKVNPYYYLGFTDKPKVAYAPSTGTGRLPDSYRRETKPLLDRFSAIAVREASAARAMSDYVDKEVRTVADPTLLLTAAEWEQVAAPVENAETPYLLCYFLSPNAWYMDYARTEARRLGMPLKVFYNRSEYRGYGDERLSVGPGEFLTYIRQATKVFTDSFHASIFSLLFHKDFVTFKRFEDGGERDQNARIADLFSRLGLSARFIGRDRLAEASGLPMPDYAVVDERLSSLREESKGYLSEALANKR